MSFVRTGNREDSDYIRIRNFLGLTKNTLKRCNRCHTMLPGSEFNRHWRYKDGLQQMCRACQRETDGTSVAAERQRRFQNKKRKEFTDWLNAYKNSPCVDCGGTFPYEALDFDHVRGEKLCNVSNAGHLKREIVLAEIEKCDLVCANCHRIRTKRRLASRTRT